MTDQHQHQRADLRVVTDCPVAVARRRCRHSMAQCVYARTHKIRVTRALLLLLLLTLCITTACPYPYPYCC